MTSASGSPMACSAAPSRTTRTGCGWTASRSLGAKLKGRVTARMWSNSLALAASGKGSSRSCPPMSWPSIALAVFGG
eukprot:7669374-Alexandrium_andersonii.AAC.1